MADRPLTIVQMVPELNCGGVEVVVSELAVDLARAGHRSIVLSSGGRMVAELETQGVEHFHWPIRAKSPWTLRVIPALRRFFQDQKVDLIHPHSRIPAWVGYLTWTSMRKQDRPAFVTTAHGLYRSKMYSEVMTRGERVIAISETVQQHLAANYQKLSKSQIRTIPLGIDQTSFSRDFRPAEEWLAAWQREFPQLIGCPTITLVGRLVRLKGHLDLIQLVDELRKRMPEIRALVVGGVDPRRSQYAAEIRAEVARRGLNQHIVFTGHRTDIREIYAVSNLVLSLSSNPPEAFGRTTIEALSMGLPVVGYDHGGTGEILRTTFPAGLVPPGKWKQAAETVERILTEHVPVPCEHQYTKQQMFQQTISVYREVVAA